MGVVSCSRWACSLVLSGLLSRWNKCGGPAGRTLGPWADLSPEPSNHRKRCPEWHTELWLVKQTDWIYGRIKMFSKWKCLDWNQTKCYHSHTRSDIFYLFIFRVHSVKHISEKYVINLNLISLMTRFVKTSVSSQHVVKLQTACINLRKHFSFELRPQPKQEDALPDRPYSGLTSGVYLLMNRCCHITEVRR